MARLCAATLAGEDLPDDALIERYLRLTSERMPDLDRRLRLDVARWKAADAIADVQAAAWVERVFRNVNLFYTSGHITALATEFMMKQLLIRSTILQPALLRAAIAEVSVLLRPHRGRIIGPCQSIRWWLSVSSCVSIIRMPPIAGTAMSGPSCNTSCDT